MVNDTPGCQGYAEPSEGSRDTDPATYRITTVRWRRENGKYVQAEQQNNGTLVFSSVSVLDRGGYLCEVNTTGFKPVTSKKANIYVIGGT